MKTSLHKDFATNSIDEWIDETTVSESSNSNLKKIFYRNLTKSDDVEHHSNKFISKIFTDITNTSDSESRPTSHKNSNQKKHNYNVAIADVSSNNKDGQWSETASKPITSKSSFLNIQEFDLKVTCKDVASPLREKKMLFLPRIFQHHRITKWLSDYYLTQRFKVIINTEFKGSPCNTLNVKNYDYCWVDFKYMRIKDETDYDNSDVEKEILCRFCYGKNWIPILSVFEHLFKSHGIITWYDNVNGKKDKFSAIEILSDQTSVKVKLLPLPEKYFALKLSDGTQRTHVKCSNCLNWIRLGWCEYDEILITDNSNDIIEMNIEDPNIVNGKVITQQRERKSINGFYENYFEHYVNCKEQEQEQEQEHKSNNYFIQLK